MNIQDQNYIIIKNLFEKSTQGEPQTEFMAMADANSLYALGDHIESSDIPFRVLRIFTCFKSLFPKFIERWYLGQVKNEIIEFKKRFIDLTNAQITDPALKKIAASVIDSPILNSDIYDNILHIIQLNQTLSEARAQLTAEGYQEAAISKAIEEVCRCLPDDLDDMPSALLDRLLYESPRLDDSESCKRFHYFRVLGCLENEFSSYLDADSNDALNKHKALLMCSPENLTTEHESAFNHIENILNDLESAKYPPDTIKIALRILLKMTSFSIREETLRDYISLNGIKHKTASYEEQTNTQRGYIDVIKDEHGNNLAKKRGSKISNKAELLAYEVEHLMGNDNVPPALQTRSGDLLQKYINNSQKIDDFLENTAGGAEQIAAMDVSAIQCYLTLSLVRGRGDGHGGNTVIYSGPEGIKPYDIDEEEDFIYQNIDLKFRDREANEGKLTSNMAAFGFPQAHQPYPKVLLKLFAWPGMKDKILKQCRYRKLSSGYRALEERLDKIIEICRFESTKTSPTLTPKDLYHFIYAKDYLYEMYKKKGYTDYEFYRGDVKCCDDQYPRSPRENTNKGYFDENVLKMDSMYNPSPFPMSDPSTREQYPGDSIIRKVYNALERSSAVDALEITPEAFDEKGWKEYQEQCRLLNKPVQSFMLSHFLQGFAKRMSKQLSHLYPFCILDIVRGENDKLFLQIRKPDHLIN